MQATNGASSIKASSKPPVSRPAPTVSRESGGSIRPMPDPYKGGQSSR